MGFERADEPRVAVHSDHALRLDQEHGLYAEHVGKPSPMVVRVAGHHFARHVGKVHLGLEAEGRIQGRVDVHRLVPLEVHAMDAARPILFALDLHAIFSWDKVPHRKGRLAEMKAIEPAQDTRLSATRP